MSKVFLSILAAACCLTAAPQTLTDDAPGVTVSLNGATLMHRSGVDYPVAALEGGIRGSVSVEVKLDATGLVSDARVLSGPDELRKSALQSVLQWHFTPDPAGATRVVEIGFDPPKGETVPALVVRQGTFGALSQDPSHVASIRITGLSEQATAQLRTSLPIHEGDRWTPDNMQKAMQAVKAFDEHLTIRTGSTTGTSAGRLVTLIVEPGSTPGRIQVGGNVQGATIVRKVAPVYPQLAKVAGISGVVRLSVLIGKDGTVLDAQVLDGPPLLQQAARDAVMQWVYRPTLLNGNPAEVTTTVDINFTLNQ